MMRLAVLGATASCGLGVQLTLHNTLGIKDPMPLIGDELEWAGPRISSFSSELTTQHEPKNVDAWLFDACDWHITGERNAFTPIWETASYALSGAGARVRLVDWSEVDTMLWGIDAAVAEGRRPLVLTMGGFLPGNHKGYPSYATMQKIRNKNVYLVYYQSEPRDRIELTTGPARTVKPDEIWDYSKVNMANYSKDWDIPVRYVPPGYAPAMELRMNHKSPERDENILSYLGNTKEIIGDLNSTLGTRYMEFNKIWTEEDFIKYLEVHPLQFNYHSGESCCPQSAEDARITPMEAFRMADLLANKACVISTPVAKEDLDMWKDIVHFAQVKEIPHVLDELQKDVPGCQERTYAAYKQHFDMRKLLRESGFFSAWSPGAASA